MTRRLDADERALWAKVIATVQPLHAQSAAATPDPPGPEAAPVAAKAPKGRVPPIRPVPAKALPTRPHSAATLDGSWDRRLSRGAVQPEMTVDLHGHTLGTAYYLLDSRLEQAIAGGVRTVLLITGKPPRGEGRPVQRGAIRAAVGDWLAASRHAGAVAAVRGAHPRHGGSGALYIILKRPK